MNKNKKNHELPTGVKLGEGFVSGSGSASKWAVGSGSALNAQKDRQTNLVFLHAFKLVKPNFLGRGNEDLRPDHACGCSFCRERDGAGLPVGKTQAEQKRMDI